MRATKKDSFPILEHPIDSATTLPVLSSSPAFLALPMPVRRPNSPTKRKREKHDGSPVKESRVKLIPTSTADHILQFNSAKGERSENVHYLETAGTRMQDLKPSRSTVGDDVEREFDTTAGTKEEGSKAQKEGEARKVSY